MWHGFRFFFLIFLWLLACVLLGLAANRLHYTLNLPPGDPLNGGKAFYNPVVVELLVVSGFAILWLPYIMFTIHKRHEGRRRHTFTHSSIGLFLLFIGFIAGTAISTKYWGRISFCWQYWQCRTLTAMVGVAWAATIVNGVLLIMELTYASRHRAWGYPMHGRYNPSNYNQSNYPPRRGRFY